MKQWIILTALLLTACNDAPPATSEANQAVSSANDTSSVPTKKYNTVQEYYQDSNNFDFKLIENNPLEFILIPKIPANSAEDIILDEYKYAGLDGLLLVFAKTDVSEVTFHIQAPKAVKLSFKAKREDVANQLKYLNINSFDDLIEHDATKGVIAGQSQSQVFLDIRKDNQKSWKLLNTFRTDKEVIGK